VQRGRQHPFAAAAALLGIAFILVAIVYAVEPAKSLPSFFPGHVQGASRHLLRHGIGALLIGLTALVVAWFEASDPRTRRP
jgi:branched-subunit amino acid ABC-type transport system permease component